MALVLDGCHTPVATVEVFALERKSVGWYLQSAGKTVQVSLLFVMPAPT